MRKGLRTTGMGGIVFLVPVIFVLMILNRAYELALEAANPIDKIIPIESLAGGGWLLPFFLAAAIVLGVCHAACVTALSSIMSAGVNKLDQFLNRAIRAYQQTKKGFIGPITNMSLEDERKVVLVGDPEERRSLGFEVNGCLAVML